MTSGDKDWQRDVYQKGKSVAIEIISRAGRPVPFAEICEQVKRRYPKLCDDSIPDPWAPSQPYWKHRVASALQALKHKSIRQTPNGWLWRGVAKEQPTESALGKRREDEQPPSRDYENKLRDGLLRTLRELPPKGFQDFVIKRLLPSLGLSDVTVRQFVRDGGIDGEGLLEISEETVIAGVIEKSSRRVKCGIQVKRVGVTISRPEIQTFRGAISGQFERGLYVTTSDFSRDAVEEASRKTGVIPITTIDGATLSRLLIEKGLGVKEITVKIIAPAFFAPYQE